MSAVPKVVTIKTACRLLGCANRRQLAMRLGTPSQTVDYWHNRRKGKLPPLWRDRVELMLLKERDAMEVRTVHRGYPPGSGSVTVVTRKDGREPDSRG